MDGLVSLVLLVFLVNSLKVRLKGEEGENPEREF
jgi:hypothetical protein